MAPQTFSTELSVVGNSVALPIPFDPNAVWGARGRHDVAGTINGHPVRGPLQSGPDGHYLPLGPAWRRGAGIEPTDRVTVELWPEGPQVDQLADDLRAALIAAPEAREFFESLPTFHRKNYVRWIDEARRPETRAARIAGAIVQLTARQRR